MKKKLKSILSAILALAMIACMAVPAFAEGNIIIYNNGSGPQQSQPGPGPQGPQGGPQQGPGSGPQGPAPKSNSNYDYAVLKGNKGTYNPTNAEVLDYYLAGAPFFEKPENGKVTIKLTNLVRAADGLAFQTVVYNGLDHTITVKRLERLLIMRNGVVIAKVPAQLLDNNSKIKAGDHGKADGTIDPQYFNHHADFAGGTYTIEADIIYE